jgi:toxin CcdB
MAQFDVFVNPVIAARPAYPYVVTLQSNFAEDFRERIVAPMAPRASMPAVSGRLTPVVDFNAGHYVVLMPAMTGVRARDLGAHRGSISAARGELLAALDYLFFGV